MQKGCGGLSAPDGILHRIPEGPHGGFPKLGVPFLGPHNKDYSILGSILGSPHFGKLPHIQPLGNWDP